jgi:hypothetical protein
MAGKAGVSTPLVGSKPYPKKLDSWMEMAVTSTLAYYDTTKILAVKVLQYRPLALKHNIATLNLMTVIKILNL